MRQISFRVRSATAILLTTVIVGCAVKVAPAPAPPKAKTTAATGAAAGPEITLHAIDKVGYDAFLFHYTGKVVLIDFWATWCPKCREDFPHTVGLDRKYASEGLVVVSFACDDADKEEEVLAFLRAQQATFKNLRAVAGADEKTFEDFQIAGGALPHYKLYDRKGNLSKTFAVDPEAEHQFSLEEIDDAVQELLAEGPKPPAAAAEETGKSDKAEGRDAGAENRTDP